MSGPLDFSDLDTSNATTTIPRFDNNSYIRVKLDKIERKTLEGKGDTVTFQWKLQDPAPTVEGTTIKPGDFGSTIFDTVYLYGKDSPGKVPERSLGELAKRQDALLGTGDRGNTKGKPERLPFGQAVPSLLGQVAFFKMRNRKDDESRQDIGEMKHVDDMPQA